MVQRLVTSHRISEPAVGTGLYCGPRLRKGEVFAYVGLPQNLKDLKDLPSAILYPHSVSPRFLRIPQEAMGSYLTPGRQ